MKMSQGADHLWLVLKHDTALDLCSLEIIERAERPIGDALVGERPQALTGLQFGRIGWQEEQMDPLGHHEFLAGMPPSSIKHQQDLLAGTGSDRLSKVGKRDGEDLRRHGRQQKPFGLASGRLNKRVEVEPLVALMYTNAWARPFAHPDTSENGFESNSMLIGRPQLNRRLGKGLLERIHLLWKFFSLGWQTRLEEDLFQNSQIRSGVLAETQLLATGLAPKGKVLPHRVPSFIIVQQEGSR